MHRKKFQICIRVYIDDGIRQALSTRIHTYMDACVSRGPGDCVLTIVLYICTCVLMCVRIWCVCANGVCVCTCAYVCVYRGGRVYMGWMGGCMCMVGVCVCVCVCVV